MWHVFISDLSYKTLQIRWNILRQNEPPNLTVHDHHTWYYVNCYFRLAVNEVFLKNVENRKCRLQRLQVEFLKNGLSQDYEIWQACHGQLAPTYLLKMTSLAVSGRLQNAIKYCTKVRTTGAVSIEANNSVTVWRKVTCNNTLNLDWMSAEIVKLSGMAFCFAPPIGGLFVSQSQMEGTESGGCPPRASCWQLAHHYRRHIKTGLIFTRWRTAVGILHAVLCDL